MDTPAYLHFFFPIGTVLLAHLLERWLSYPVLKESTRLCKKYTPFHTNLLRFALKNYHVIYNFIPDSRHTLEQHARPGDWWRCRFGYESSTAAHLNLHCGHFYCYRTTHSNSSIWAALLTRQKKGTELDKRMKQQISDIHFYRKICDACFFWRRELRYSPA